MENHGGKTTEGKNMFVKNAKRLIPQQRVAESRLANIITQQ